jgi:two-component system chemotaxis response regulator CheB
MPIQVMIIDDSAVVRQVIAAELSREPDMRVIGTAPDPITAMARMKTAWPDVIVLDLEMPRMDGMTFLRKLMAERPTPVVICSSLTRRGAAITIEALSAGALAVVPKPSLGVRNFLQDNASDLVEAIRAANAARGRLRPIPWQTQSTPSAAPAKPVNTPARASVPGARPAAASYVSEKMRSPKLSADAMLEAPTAPVNGITERIVVIGISTGGVQALEQLLPALPEDCPPIAIVQHMPEKFTRSFADRLNNLCRVTVREACDGDRLQQGLVLIAPGGRHMMIRREGMNYRAEIVDGPLVSRHRPSVDVLFRSAAKWAGRNAMGIIMTGMGDDGARGLKELRDMGGQTVAQDEASCTVFGMPREAIKLGAVETVAALDALPGLIGRAGRPHRTLMGTPDATSD